MKNIIKILTLLILPALAAGFTQTASAIRIHSEKDTVTVNRIISQLSEPGGKVSGKMLGAAEAFYGIPLGTPLRDDSIGTLEINLSEFDDMTFLNNVLAMAKTLTSPNPRWREFAFNLEKVSCRRGVDKGFSSRMIYGGDWISDNVFRGNVKDLTEYDNNPNFKTKSLEYVTRHRNEFKALADSATFEDMKMVEMGFRTHKIPHLKKEWSSKEIILEDMKDGDIIFFLTNEPDFDVYLVGIVKMKEDGPHLIHISKEEGKVIEDPQTLNRQIKKETKRIYGWRWLRAAD